MGMVESKRAKVCAVAIWPSASTLSIVLEKKVKWIL